MDNRAFKMTLEGKDDFTLAMQIGLKNHKTVGYRIHDLDTLILYWTKSEKMIPLPYEMSINDTINFVWGWFDQIKPSEKEPFFDGNIGKGFCIFCDENGRVFEEWQASLAITPIEAYYGK